MLKESAITDVQVGDVFCHTWGYDQTNVEWYQVVAKRAATIQLRQVAAEITPSGDMTGHSRPRKDQFIPMATGALCAKADGAPSCVKRPYKYPANAYLPGVWVPAVYGACRLWDGRPQAYSSYA